MYGSSDVCSSDLRAGPSPCLPKPEAPAPPGPRPIMAEKARVGVLISGRGSNMAALLYASRQPDCPYEIALVASNNPDAAGLKLAEAEEVATFALGHKGMKRADYDRDRKRTRLNPSHSCATRIQHTDFKTQKQN